MKRKIIIDTDPGHDDAMALMLAIKSGLFDVKAITTVCGNSTIENTTRNARWVLELLDRKDIPIYSGAGRPLNRELIQAVVHGESGLDGINPTNEANLTNNAVDKIIEIVDNNKNVTLVTLGPLTNIALAIQQNPDVMEKVQEIVMMGGAIRVPGNKNRVAEFNIFVDPEAANIVFNFPVKKTMVPLDACNDIKFYLEDFEKIENGTLRDPLLKMMEPYIRNISGDEGVQAALMYDPLTIYYLISSENCETIELNVKISTSKELTRGMTVADLRKKPDSEPNVTVVEKISENAFRKCFIETLSN